MEIGKGLLEEEFVPEAKRLLEKPEAKDKLILRLTAASAAFSRRKVRPP
jgi:hypothetical protein